MTFIERIGSPTLVEHDPFRRPDGTCPECRGRVYVVAGTTTRIAHFRHRDAARCPTSAPAGEPYLRLMPSHADPAAGIRLRASFVANWRKHFVMVASLVPYLSPEEFVSLIERADEQRVWEHRELEERWIPQTLVLLADFPPWTSTRKDGRHARERWFRFWYVGRHAALDELWIEMRRDAKLCRASFVAPARRNGRPAYQDLLFRRELQPDTTYLSGDVREPAGFIIRSVEDKLLHRG